MAKRKGLTRSKARERVAELEESIRQRQTRLEQVLARISRVDEPDPKLLEFQSKLERKQEVERSQMVKLQSLLSAGVRRQSQESEPESHSDETNLAVESLKQAVEELKREFGSLRSALNQIDTGEKYASQVSDLDRRMKYHEEAFAALSELVAELDEAHQKGRQQVRKLGRALEERDDRFETLREAVEESVLATMDLAERVDEMEEGAPSNQASGASGMAEQAWNRLAELESQIEELNLKHSREFASLEALWVRSQEELPAVTEDSPDDLSERMLNLEERLLKLQGEPLFVYTEDELPLAQEDLFEGGIQLPA